jgi:GDP-L-fucose synthase
MADACVYLMKLPYEQFNSLLGSHEAKTSVFLPPVVNICVGKALSIKELAEMEKDIVGCQGDITFDATKPDSAPRKLMNISCLEAIGRKPRIGLESGLPSGYRDFLLRGVGK